MDGLIWVIKFYIFGFLTSFVLSFITSKIYEEKFDVNESIKTAFKWPVVLFTLIRNAIKYL